MRMWWKLFFELCGRVRLIHGMDLEQEHCDKFLVVFSLENSIFHNNTILKASMKVHTQTAYQKALSFDLKQKMQMICEGLLNKDIEK